MRNGVSLDDFGRMWTACSIRKLLACICPIEFADEANVKAAIRLMPRSKTLASSFAKGNTHCCLPSLYQRVLI